MGDWKDIIQKLKKVCRRGAILLLREVEVLEGYISDLERENSQLKLELERLRKELSRLKEESKLDGKEIKYLFGKYLSLWNNEPPEKWKSASWKGMLGKHFKKALKLFGNPKEVWKEYEEFYSLFKEFEEGRLDYQSRIKYSKLFYDGSFSNFISKLSLWKTLRGKEREKKYSDIDWL